MGVHKTLVDLASEIYGVSKRGVCRGMTMRWIEACLLGEEDLFNARLKYMVSNQKKLKAALTDKSAVFPKDPNMQSALVFLESLVLYQSPDTFSSVFLDKSITQAKVEEVSELASSKGIQEQGGLTVSAEHLRLFTKDEFTSYLNNLSTIIDAQNPKGPVTFILSLPNHAMGMSYEVGKGWKFMDINTYDPKHPEPMSAENISAKLFADYKGKGPQLALSSTFITTKTNHDSLALKEKLKQMQTDYTITPEIAQWEDKVNLLWLAVKKGHIDMVKELIKQGADVNQIHIQGQDSLIWRAYANGHIEIAKLLIENGVDLTASISGQELITMAAYDGHLDIIKALIAREGVSKIIEKDFNGFTPLYLAISKGHLDVVKYLIENGADVNLKCNGTTPLLIACKSGNAEIFKLLLENNAKGFEKLKTRPEHLKLLSIAILAGHFDIIKVLATQNVNLNTRFKATAAELRKIPKDSASLARMEAFIQASSQKGSKDIAYTALDIAKILDNKNAIEFLSEKAPVKKERFSSNYFKSKLGLVTHNPELPLTAEQGALALKKLANSTKFQSGFNFEKILSFLCLIEANLKSGSYFESKQAETIEGAADKVAAILGGDKDKRLTPAEISACNQGELGKLVARCPIKLDEFAEYAEKESSLNKSV